MFAWERIESDGYIVGVLCGLIEANHLGGLWREDGGGGR